MNVAHLDYDTLADLAEGLLDDSRAASADAHLTGCATCRDRAAELAEVSRVLAEAPAPSVPPELISRIDAALAAAATETAGDARPDRWRRLPLMAAAAAAVVAVGGGALIMRPVTDSAEAPAGAQRAAEPSRARPDSRSEAAKPSVTAQKADAFPVTRSGTNYRKKDLADQLPETPRLGQPPASGQPPRPRTPGAQGQAPAQGDALSQRLSGCIARIGDGRAPVLVDLARYEDAPAAVIVFRGEGENLDVWVTGPQCSQDTSDVIEHVEAAGTD